MASWNRAEMDAITEGAARNEQSLTSSLDALQALVKALNHPADMPVWQVKDNLAQAEREAREVLASNGRKL